MTPQKVNKEGELLAARPEMGSIRFVEFIKMQNFRKLLLSLLPFALGACISPPPPPAIEVRQAIPLPINQQSTAQSLANVRAALPDVICDLRYASSHNVTGRAVYPADMPCLLQVSTVTKLGKAQEYLRAHGYRLKIWDAWRPAEVQVSLHDSTRDTQLFVDPQEAWSKHCCGMAVDVTLVDAKGKEVLMPSDFDATGVKAASTYIGSNPVMRRNLALLQTAMIQAGFKPIDSEWWHFDDTDFLEGSPPPPIHARDAGVLLPSA